MSDEPVWRTSGTSAAPILDAESDEYLIAPFSASTGTFPPVNMLPAPTNTVAFLHVSPPTSSDAAHLIPILSPAQIETLLRRFEHKYHMPSKTFYKRWQQGRAQDTFDTIAWVTLWESFRDFHYSIE